MILRLHRRVARHPNKKAEAQKTLIYSNAMIGYCNRLNSFAQSTQLLLRDGQKVLAGDISATKYMLPPLFDEKSLDIAAKEMVRKIRS